MAGLPFPPEKMNPHPLAASESTIDVIVNGDVRAVSRGADVALLVEALGLGPGRVAVEVNRQIVPRAQWSRPLSAGDRVEIVAFVGGG